MLSNCCSLSLIKEAVREIKFFINENKIPTVCERCDKNPRCCYSLQIAITRKEWWNNWEMTYTPLVTSLTRVETMEYLINILENNSECLSLLEKSNIIYNLTSKLKLSATSLVKEYKVSKSRFLKFTCKKKGNLLS